MRGALAAAMLAATPAVAAERIGDPAQGAVIFAAQCAACHQVGEGARNRVGPHLNGIFDRKAGVLEGVTYSRGMVRMGSDGLHWTLETLDAYIENPRALVSGTRMSYRGLRDPQGRADVIAYLRDFSAMPQNIPESAPTARKTPPGIDPAVLEIKGDVEYGEYLAAECTTCHQRDGSDQGIPAITGWPEEDFVIAMHAYKVELRPHPVMQMMAKRLADDEIAALAAYFAQID
ncbi:MAG: c-type cytochrome [Gemmobacter sp.]